MRLVVGIINFKNYGDLPACRESLLKGRLVPDRILLVDNQTDESRLQEIRTLFGAKDVLASPLNRGYSGGANVVLEAADNAEFVLLLNPDVRVGAAFCEEMIEAAKRNPEAALLTGKLLRPEPGILDSTGVLALRSGRSRDRGAGTPDIGFDRPEEVFGGTGAALFVRRKAVEDLRLQGEIFDEDFLIYHEDNDLCWRARLLGWKVLYVPAATGIHARAYRPGGRGAMSRFVRGHAFKNHYLKLVKNLLFPQLLRDSGHLAGWELVRLGHMLLREPFLLAWLWKALMLLPKTWRKRRLLMRRRRVGYREMAPWFV